MLNRASPGESAGQKEEVIMRKCLEDGFYVLDLEEEIKQLEKAIEHRIKKSGLTEKQLAKGLSLCKAYDYAYQENSIFLNEYRGDDFWEKNEDLQDEIKEAGLKFDDVEYIVKTVSLLESFRAQRVFNKVCELFEFDYREVMDICRDSTVLSVYEALKDRNGICLFIEHDETPDFYFGIRKSLDYNSEYVTYRWNCLDKIIEFRCINEATDWIAEAAKDLLNNKRRGIR
jgi:hypothetical protein